MEPIYLLVKNDDELREILCKALVRSFSRSQICILDADSPIPYSGSFYVLANADTISPSFDTEMLPERAKVLFLGRPDKKLIRQLKLSDTTFHFLDYCNPAEPNAFSTSKEFVRYRNHPLTQYVNQSERALCRYDFKNTWNNLGYGQIKNSNDIWSVAAPLQSPYSIANISNPEGNEEISYAAVFDDEHQSVLWINREVGSVDSFEWHMVEQFFSSYRSTDMPCIAHLLDIPANTESIVTVRLDCHENISGVMDLLNEYNSLRIPLSLSITDTMTIEREMAVFLHTVVGHGGAVLSNPIIDIQDTQLKYDRIAMAQESLSRRIQHEISYAVCNTPVSMKFLKDSGYKGFVAGNERIAPYYQMFRGGDAPFSDHIVSHYQPCMFHGDCMLSDEMDPMLVYKQAFMNSLKTRSTFSFFDNAISDTNTHGWKSAEEQMRRHRELIGFIRKQANVIFVNENECLDFMNLKSNCEIYYTRVGDSIYPKMVYTSDTLLKPALEWKGTVFIE